MSVGVVISTFGDIDTWQPLARRALRSAKLQTRSPAYSGWHHGADATLAQVRNSGALLARTEWLIFLDGDDELDDHYVEAMLAGTGDIRQPSTIEVVDGVDSPPVLIPKRDLLRSNYIVVGAMIRTELFMDVGGFRELPIYEDWDLWLRCEEAGADIQPCPDAVYRVNVRPDSRNNQPPAIQMRWYWTIRNEAAARRSR